jgi:ribonuclease III family protein
VLVAQSLSEEQIRNLPLRLLAHLGDAVFHLFERERQITSSGSARQLHQKSTLTVSAKHQAELLSKLSEVLTASESELVRRARNLKPSGYRKSGQNAYRQATAFEALLGYLYLQDQKRLKEILNWTCNP